MKFTVRAITLGDVSDISGWRYAAPYAVYNEAGDSMPGDRFRALCDPSGALAGFFCWGAEARVPAARAFYRENPAPLDFGMGLRPELTGKGLGLMAASCALAYLRAAYHPVAFRLTVFAWNARARRVYARLGFTPETKCGRFAVMTLDERPFRDATRALEEGVRVYPSDPAFSRALRYTKEACGWDVSLLTMSAHTGTHIDAPAHMGLPGDTESVPLANLNGAAQLLDWETPAPACVRAPRLLLHTHGRGLTRSDAAALAEAGVRLVGVDALSVGAGDEERAVHQLCFESGVTILENAALEAFAPGWYEMRCLPLRLPGSDGAPVRLLLREDK
jgi:arylformamidase